MAIISTLCGAAVPHALIKFERPRTLAAARYVATRMMQAQTQAVMRAAIIGIRFTPGADGVHIDEIIDGNRNGIRAADVESGVDRRAGAALLFSDQFPRVVIELTDATTMSFTPVGTATSRTIYLRGTDGSRFGVRVLGATGRTRVIRYDPLTDSWVEMW